ncbi:MAG TPA: PIN domain-containing protein [Chloroflexota bacterium]|nr:PIN domain-containing protein [Chloroflexota bacterium]
MIVLDASVLIAYLDGHDEHHAAAEALLAHLIDDDLGANSLTLAEVFVAPLRDGRLRAVQEALSDLEIHELSFPIDTAVRLAQLRLTTGLKMPDCCVLLAADVTAGSVASFDQRLAQAAEASGVTVLRG